MKPHYFKAYGQYFAIVKNNDDEKFTLMDNGGPVGIYNSVADAKADYGNLEMCARQQQLMRKLGGSAPRV